MPARAALEDKAVVVADGDRGDAKAEAEAARVAMAVHAAGGGGHVQLQDHVHGYHCRLLPLQLYIARNKPR